MSFPTWFFDYDNDGWLDLFVAGTCPSSTESPKPLPRPAAARRDHARSTTTRATAAFEDVTAQRSVSRA